MSARSCWTLCWTKCWTLFRAKMQIPTAISISNDACLRKFLGVGAGEGNRTLVFSLEVAEFRNGHNGHSDILQPCGLLRPLQNLSLSEWRRGGFATVDRAPYPSRFSIIFKN